MTWHSPLAFLLLVVLVAALIIDFLYLKKKKPTLQYSSLRGIRSLPRGLRARLAGLPHILKIFSAIFIILALARPQLSDTKVKRNVDGIDIMTVIDVSDSMAIEDMKPNRMESAKNTIAEFIRKRDSDRIGLIIFSGDSYTRVPLTLDYQVLLDSLKKVEPQTALKKGTAIGVGLANAVARLKDSTAKSRVVILLTDGENNTGTIDPETALDMAKGYKIRIYTIGIGLDGEAQLPIYAVDMFGRRVKTYQPIHSSVNDALLGKLATETGGKYYRASTTNALQNVFSDINRLEKSKIQINKFTRYTENYQKYLLWALYLFLCALFLKYSFLRRGP